MLAVDRTVSPTALPRARRRDTASSSVGFSPQPVQLRIVGGGPPFRHRCPRWLHWHEGHLLNGILGRPRSEASRDGRRARGCRSYLGRTPRGVSIWPPSGELGAIHLLSAIRAEAALRSQLCAGGCGIQRRGRAAPRNPSNSLPRHRTQRRRNARLAIRPRAPGPSGRQVVVIGTRIKRQTRAQHVDQT